MIGELAFGTFGVFGGSPETVFAGFESDVSESEVAVLVGEERLSGVVVLEKSDFVAGLGEAGDRESGTVCGFESSEKLRWGRGGSVGFFGGLSLLKFFSFQLIDSIMSSM